ncbi:BnaC08g11870D [Brassica napus]|uniref:BnaC08g11870D protein n=1 Tax=Brassica napus TaxID=3708 RepID=A0A078F773_BRANA|nr:BnaC08g11870D [Brassica napus]
MMLARACAAAGVVDGKIYVVGGVKEPNPRKWVVEVFDPKRQTWSTLSNQPQTQPDDLYSPSLTPESGVIEVEKMKKIFGLNEKGNVWLYTPSQGIWKTGNSDTNKLRKGWHVIDNVIYSCGWILWCEASDLEESAGGGMKWRQVMGLEDLRVALCASRVVNYSRGFMPSEYLDDMLPGHKLSNSGPNMLLFWDCLADWKWEIRCAEISLQRRKGTGEIWGTVEWSEAVTRIDRPLDQHPYHCKILYSLSFNL